MIETKFRAILDCGATFETDTLTIFNMLVKTGIKINYYVVSNKFFEIYLYPDHYIYDGKMSQKFICSEKSIPRLILRCLEKVSIGVLNPPASSVSHSYVLGWKSPGSNDGYEVTISA
ncbi:MAG: hypothetical protein WC451_02770 [Patescibacteria group bacterium]